MIKAYRIHGNGLIADEGTEFAHAAWIDMLEPSDAERTEISALIGVEVAEPRGPGGDRAVLAALLSSTAPRL